MLFNSFTFLVFLVIVFCLYWFVFNRNYKVQNILILTASYFFYGWWDWKYLILIILTSMTNYIIGYYIPLVDGRRRQRILLSVSLIVSLGMLMAFKYFNFFIDSMVDMLALLNLRANIHSLRIILPIGISFYTFQTLSYTIDVYRKKIQPTTDIISFFAFVSFFPQLVAGPIERAKNLLPQFQKRRVFDVNRASDGLRQMLWGFFKKIVIADNASVYVDEIFNNIDGMPSGTLIIGIIYFAFQIYCDFSGYSDIAIGTARLFGFDLMRNFAYPYFSRDIAEFWRRWHISLTTWFRDYLYIPLGGSRASTRGI